MINKKGLAQIPLMIGLLIMALAVPVATKLVQQNQENRGQAACYANYAGCNNNASCCSGVCSGVCMPASNPTTRPVATSTPRPAPTSTPVPCKNNGSIVSSASQCCSNYAYYISGSGLTCLASQPTSTPNPCSVSNGKPSNCPCSYNNQCSSGYCSGVCTTPPPSTATPTNDPRQPCGSWRSDECSTGSCTGGNVCINNHATGSKCLCITPTATPTNDPRQPCGSWRSDECSTGSCTGGNVCINNHSIDSKCVCIAPTVTPTKIPGGGPIVPIVTNPPGDDNMCPQAEACPHSETDLLRNCTPADADGTSKDTRCYADTVGTRGQCGGKEYCCPSAGGAWTLDMTKCPATCKVKTEAYTLNDFSIWRSEFITGDFGVTVNNTWNADFDCDGKVTLNDFSVWRTNFIKGLLNN